MDLLTHIRGRRSAGTRFESNADPHPRIGPNAGYRAALTQLCGTLERGSLDDSEYTWEEAATESGERYIMVLENGIAQVLIIETPDGAEITRSDGIAVVHTGPTIDAAVRSFDLLLHPHRMN